MPVLCVKIESRKKNIREKAGLRQPALLLDCVAGICAESAPGMGVKQELCPAAEAFQGRSFHGHSLGDHLQEVMPLLFLAPLLEAQLHRESQLRKPL